MEGEDDLDLAELVNFDATAEEVLERIEFIIKSFMRAFAAGELMCLELVQFCCRLCRCGLVRWTLKTPYEQSQHRRTGL